MNIKPMLAVDHQKVKDLDPRMYLASGKIDGIRCVILRNNDGRPEAFSRSLKPIPNKHVQYFLSREAYLGMDGELTVGRNFQESTSGIMSRNKVPDFFFWVFDFIDTSYLNLSFEERYDFIKNRLEGFGRQSTVQLLPSWSIGDMSLEDVNHQFVREGFEGCCLRRKGSPYKFGRSGTKNPELVKVKTFKTSTATVLDWFPLHHNLNEAQTNELGLTERSHCKSGKVASHMLGGLLVEDGGIQFHVGTGFTTKQRQRLPYYELKDKKVLYKYQPHGVKDKPRSPVFIRLC